MNQVAYTAQFGNGVSASVALQDPTVYDTTNISNLSFPGGVQISLNHRRQLNVLPGYGASSLAGALVAPDVIGTITIDQAWGMFKLSAVAHDNHASYYGPVETFGHPADKWGWAVQPLLDDQKHSDWTGRRHQHAGCLYGRCKPLQFPKLVPDHHRDV